MLRIWRFVALLLAALGLIMGGAHVLELPPKMQYDPALYATVNSSLYRLYGSIGAVLQLGSVIAAAVLTFLVRGRASFRWTLLGTIGLLLSLVLWSVLVAPVNAEWLEVIETAPASVAAVYERLRPRWEYGHVVAFVAWLMGFSFLLISVVGETPANRYGRSAV